MDCWIMADPNGLLADFGPLLMEGAFTKLAARYQTPCVIEMHGQQIVLDTQTQLVRMLSDYADHVRASGVVRINSTVKSLGYVADASAFATVEIEYFDASDEVVNQSQTSYVLNRAEGQWQIAVVAIGRSAGGICDAFLGSAAA